MNNDDLLSKIFSLNQNSGGSIGIQGTLTNTITNDIEDIQNSPFLLSVLSQLENKYDE